MDKEEIKQEISRFIELLVKLRDNSEEMTWGEMCELRFLDYRISEYIEKEWREW